MPASSILKNKGLYTFSNYFTSIPEGGMLVADNCIIDRDGIIEPRRGISDYTNVGNDVSKINKQLFVYKNRILAFLNGELYFDDGSGNFTAFTTDGTNPFTFNSPGIYRPKGLEAQGNFYFTTDDGVKKISASSVSDFVSTPGSIPEVVSAGGVRASDINLALDTSVINGFLPPGNAVSYRILWGYTDSNNNLILGYPSFNSEITNTTATPYGVTITAEVPNELINKPIGTKYFYQLYRSLVTANPPASDELNQVYEAPYDGTSTTITIHDNTPESIRNSGTPLYTNENSGTGIASANSPPPLCQDLTTYKNITFYANTKAKQTLSLTMQGLDGFNVIDSISSIVFGGVVSTFTCTSHRMPIGRVAQVVIFASNSNAPAIVTATFTSSTTFTIPGDYSSYNPSLTNVFTSYLDVYYDNPQLTQRFFFVGRATETSLHIGDAKASIPSNTSFKLNSADNTVTYLFWYKLTPTDTYTGSVPAGASVVPIDVSGGSVISATDVAGVTASTLTATGDFVASSTGADVSIATADSGNVATGSAAFVVAPGGTWSISQNVDGVGESISNRFIKLSSEVSAGLAIESTSKSMVKVISSNIPDVNLYYTSDITALPGSMTIIAVDNITPEFALVADLLKFSDNSLATGNMFNPVIGIDLLTTQAFSQAEVNLNRFYYSKPYEPESVPALNFIDVGPKDKAILRIIALRNTLFILKEEAIYSLTGTDSTTFYLALFDSSTLLVAPDTAQVLNNQIYMLSSQGVATVTETGVGIVSRPVEDIFTRIKNPTFTNYSTASFGASYESDRAYLIFTVFNTGDTYATKVYRYNTFTQAWTSWTWNATCAIVNPTVGIDKLYIGSAVDNTLEVERKNLSRTDYADKEYPLEYIEDGINGNNIKVSTVSNVAVGDMLVQTQYLTLSQFNRLLIKLDKDGGFGTNFVSTFTAVPGNGIGLRLLYLTTFLNGISSHVTVSSGSENFATAQSDFNTLIGQLNSSLTPTVFKDYQMSTGTVNQEILIVGFQQYHNIITADIVTPILFGPVTLFKGIPTQIDWAPVAFGDPSITKHVREGTFLFEFDALSSASVGYASDLSPNFELITFGLEGDGSWGHNSWGGFTWGGKGSSRPFRTLIPRQKQRCRFIKAQFNHTNAYYKFSILGISFVFETTSTRGYR